MQARGRTAAEPIWAAIVAECQVHEAKVQEFLASVSQKGAALRGQSPEQALRRLARKEVRPSRESPAAGALCGAAIWPNSPAWRLLPTMPPTGPHV